MIYNIAIPQINKLKLLKHIHNKNDQTPILMISTTKNIANITKTLHLNIKNILLKPIKNLNRLHEIIFTYLYPNIFNSHIKKKKKLFHD